MKEIKRNDKTFVVDCISKRVKVNNGERKKYYVENNHPAIVDAATFARVQEEMDFLTEIGQIPVNI